MNKIIKETISKIYVEKDYEFYKMVYKKEIDYLNYLIEVTKPYYKEFEIFNLDNSFQIQVNFINYYKENNFNVQYVTKLYMSKICNIYYIQHEFNIDNLDPNRTELKLNGFDNQTYTIEQYNLESKVVDILSKNNLKQLQFIDLKQIINLNKTEGLLIEKQITLEDLLFKNIYNIV